MQFKYVDMKNLMKELSELESKVNFLMQVVQVKINVGHPLDPAGVQEALIPAEVLFREVMYNGARIVDAKGAPTVTSPVGGDAAGNGAAHQNGGEPAADSPTPGSPEYVDGIIVQ